MSTAVTPPPPSSRRQQFIQTYRMAKKTDRTIGLWILGSFVLGAVLGFAIIWLLPGDGTLSLILSIIGALLVGLLLALVVFGRRAQKAAYGQMKGQVGAAASALTMLRRGWKTDPVVGFNRQQDVVHRVVGPPGVVLVGEGNPQRLRALMNVEHRKHARVLPDTPIHEVVCGDGEGEVPLDKLVRHVSKLPKSLKGGDMTDVLNRLKAIDAQRGTLPLPKGPVPSSMKGMRGQQRGR
jgi:hypothetical protein